LGWEGKYLTAVFRLGWEGKYLTAVFRSGWEGKAEHVSEHVVKCVYIYIYVIIKEKGECALCMLSVQNN